MPTTVVSTDMIYVLYWKLQASFSMIMSVWKSNYVVNWTDLSSTFFIVTSLHMTICCIFLKTVSTYMPRKIGLRYKCYKAKYLMIFYHFLWSHVNLKSWQNILLGVQSRDIPCYFDKMQHKTWMLGSTLISLLIWYGHLLITETSITGIEYE